jgi:glycosyltransferase involved in cell wall biosynthesis
MFVKRRAALQNHINPKRRIRVFVHLAHNKDLKSWRAAWSNGSLVGINDPTPYGYGRAEHMGCDVEFSEAHTETFITKSIRYIMRGLLGFDYVHAFRQRKRLFTSDVVWTHTESQYLAVAAVMWGRRGPRILAQTVWLFDKWKSVPLVLKILYKKLIEAVDILTVHSSHNLEIAKNLFPNKQILLVPFGIPTESLGKPSVKHHSQLVVVAPGNDRHRDWTTLVSACDMVPGIKLTILSSNASKKLMTNRKYLHIGKANSNTEFMSFISEADVVCVPLSTNYHASGITVVQEAVSIGVPVIASDTGGLRDYFSDGEISYVPVGDVNELYKALMKIKDDKLESIEKAIRAQEHLIKNKIGAESYIRQHVDISNKFFI